MIFGQCLLQYYSANFGQILMLLSSQISKRCFLFSYFSQYYVLPIFWCYDFRNRMLTLTFTFQEIICRYIFYIVTYQQKMNYYVNRPADRQGQLTKKSQKVPNYYEHGSKQVTFQHRFLTLPESIQLNFIAFPENRSKSNIFASAQTIALRSH